MDLRPVASRPELEVFVGGKAERAGQIDDAPKEPDDSAADAAVAQALAAGLYAEEEKRSFEYPYYWRALDQMMRYFDEHWSQHAILPADVVQQARQLVNSSAFDSKLRVRRKMIIATYRKL